MSKFSEHYKYIHKQLDDQGKIYLNTIVDFLNNLTIVLEDHGIDGKKYKEILIKKNKEGVKNGG